MKALLMIIDGACESGEDRFFHVKQETMEMFREVGIDLVKVLTVTSQSDLHDMLRDCVKKRVTTLYLLPYKLEDTDGSCEWVQQVREEAENYRGMKIISLEPTCNLDTLKKELAETEDDSL